MSKSGFVSILGRPNAGKSTLLNTLVGSKLAIVTDKPQTTRTLIQGVLTLPEAQIVFVDTPGIHKADSPLNKRMMHSVREALDQRDLLLYVVDSRHGLGTDDRHALDLVKKVDTPVVLVLNKVDLVKGKANLLALIEKYRELHEFADYVPISAKTGDGLDVLRKVIIDRLPEGPAYFPEDHVTDQPERFLAAELIREKILQETRQEIPHSVAVMVDRWEDAGDLTRGNLTRIYATILVERDGQKGIVIGARGAMLKRIGMLARGELETLLDRHVFLDLHVKVQPGWRENPAFLNALDWRTMAAEDDT
jgi:GTP-binding protein Era